MVNKITDNISPLGEIDKINEVIDQVNTNATAISSIQTTPTSGTNIIVTSAITSPSGYTQTEYLKCDGNQFIDTGWHFSGTFPIRFDCKFVVDSYVGGTGGYPVVYGLQTSGYSNWIYPFYINGGNFNPHIGGSASIDVVPCSLNTTYDTTFIIDNGTWTRTINGVTTSGTWSGTITQDANMFLGGGSYGTNAINQLFGRICSFRITEGNTVVRDYVSHRRNTDGVYGMYDFATSTFKASDSPAPFGGGLSVVGTTIGANLPRYVSQFANDRGYQTTANLVTSVSTSSTDAQYPSAKCVYDELKLKQQELVSGSNIKTINSASLLGSGNISITSGHTWGTTRPTSTSSTVSSTNPAVVVTNYVNGTSWYRVWSDKWCEQGGVTEAGSVTFPKPFANTNYTVLVNNRDEDYNANSQADKLCQPKNLTTTSFDTNGRLTMTWFACGYIS